MTARCWGCEFNIAPVGMEMGALPLDPLGACWECHVFGCPAHAERDAGSGKYMCFPSVATAVSASAGLEEFEPAIRFERGDIDRRFPRLANATRSERMHWSSGEGEGLLADRLHEVAGREVNFFLAADALGIVSFLNCGEERVGFPEAAGATLMMGQPPAVVVPGHLGELAANLL